MFGIGMLCAEYNSIQMIVTFHIFDYDEIEDKIQIKLGLLS